MAEGYDGVNPNSRGTGLLGDGFRRADLPKLLVTGSEAALGHDGDGPATILDRELYDEALAAEVLGVPRATLHYWLEGGERRGRTYAPILRPSATGSIPLPGASSSRLAT
jgi:hypothetical protein